MLGCFEGGCNTVAKTGFWDRRVEGGGGHGKNCLAPASGKSARALLASVDDILGLSLSSSW